MTRKITIEEKKLWKIATRGVDIKSPPCESDDSPMGNCSAKLKAGSAPASRKVELSEFVNEVGKVKVKLTPIQDMLPQKKVEKKPVRELISGVRNAMDMGSFSKLKKGKVQIEGRIDLHGMWISEAHVATRNFIMMSHAAGKRCVLVITGKGGIRGDGKIRAEFPKWLNDQELRPSILSFTQATPEHGGAGAFYVYLRK